MSHLVAVATYPATCGVQVRCGARQSIPSTNIESCAGLSVTTPSLVIGQTKRPFSRPQTGDRRTDRASEAPVPAWTGRLYPFACRSDPSPDKYAHQRAP